LQSCFVSSAGLEHYLDRVGVTGSNPVRNTTKKINPLRWDFIFFVIPSIIISIMENQSKKATPLALLGEFGLIDKLTKPFEIKNLTTIKGVGDDAAVIRPADTDLVVTTDLLLEGVHFDLIYTPLVHLGYKAVVVNLSDVYAMGATPNQITVSIAVSSKFSVEALEQLYEGIKKACDFYQVDLVGGDTTSSMTGLVISITAIGSVAKGKAIGRNGAKPGDLVCVSGDLGASYAGLQILKREKEVYLVNPKSQPDLKDYDYVIERQLKPEARRDVIKKLSEAGLAPTSMIDISDGLSSEIMHICKQSGCGVKLFEDKLPMDAQTIAVAQELNMEPTLFAMNGGEDYELLFTIQAADQAKASQIGAITIIGQITGEKDNYLLMGRHHGSATITAQGWNAYQ
jgi:thiamine-monophosphate kinase